MNEPQPPFDDDERWYRHLRGDGGTPESRLDKQARVLGRAIRLRYRMLTQGHPMNQLLRTRLLKEAGALPSPHTRATRTWLASLAAGVFGIAIGALMLRDIAPGRTFSESIQAQELIPGPDAKGVGPRRFRLVSGDPQGAAEALGDQLNRGRTDYTLHFSDDRVRMILPRTARLPAEVLEALDRWGVRISPGEVLVLEFERQARP